jgi:hypothetical protein
MRYLLLNIKSVYSTDEIGVNASSPSYNNTSGITQNYIGPINNPWMYDYNIGLFIFDNNPLTDTTIFNNNNFLNTTASFSGNIGGRSGTGNFLNISSWNGYLWRNPPNLNSNAFNYGNISSTLNLNNVNVLDSEGMNFLNHSIYFPNVVNSNFYNYVNINNVCNVSNSLNIVNIYNYAVYAFNPGDLRLEIGKIV